MAGPFTIIFLYRHGRARYKAQLFRVEMTVILCSRIWLARLKEEEEEEEEEEEDDEEHLSVLQRPGFVLSRSFLAILATLLAIKTLVIEAYSVETVHNEVFAVICA